ncbi:hypothetical protein [Pseudomonas chlororaphis]|uniref:hypothetical protein n=1 Tax=Pseudomonas chlororaphis TaxID=587753 RepID=UPI0018E93C3A|nr:hypothetical protein [Pseudomonas chlororaphis]
MTIFEEKEFFEVMNGAVSREELLRKAPKELVKLITGKDLIILPSHGTSDAFYTGTLDTLDYFNAHSIDAEIYSTDNDYKELSLHAADFWLGSFFVGSVLVPLVCNLISSYIYDKLKAKEEDNVSLEIIIEKKDGSTVSLDFKGKVGALDKILDAARRIEREV